MLDFSLLITSLQAIRLSFMGWRRVHLPQMERVDGKINSKTFLHKNVSLFRKYIS